MLLPLLRGESQQEGGGLCDGTREMKFNCFAHGGSHSPDLETYWLCNQEVQSCKPARHHLHFPISQQRHGLIPTFYVLLILDLFGSRSCNVCLLLIILCMKHPVWLWVARRARLLGF